MASKPNIETLRDAGEGPPYKSSLVPHKRPLQRTLERGALKTQQSADYAKGPNKSWPINSPRTKLKGNF